MFKIKDHIGDLIETVPEITYIRWGRNGVPKVCSRHEAEGLVLSDKQTLCRLIDREDISELEKVSVEETPIDSTVCELKTDSYTQNESIMQSLSDAEADRELQSICETENTETIMQAISDLQADIELNALDSE